MGGAGIAFKALDGLEIPTASGVLPRCSNEELGMMAASHIPDSFRVPDKLAFIERFRASTQQTDGLHSFGAHR